MDSFEQLVAMFLQRLGYRVQTSYSVRLTEEDRTRIGMPSCPRWEIDLVAYRADDSRVLAVKCRSSLNGAGVRYKSFSGQTRRGAKTYKLFTDAKLRETILSRLRKQLDAEGLVASPGEVTLCLAAGRLRGKNRAAIQQHCKDNGWLLFADDWFREQFASLADSDRRDDTPVIPPQLVKACFSPE
jgi:hypothetical protein